MDRSLGTHNNTHAMREQDYSELSFGNFSPSATNIQQELAKQNTAGISLARQNFPIKWNPGSWTNAQLQKAFSNMNFSNGNSMKPISPIPQGMENQSVSPCTSPNPVEAQHEAEIRQPRQMNSSPPAAENTENEVVTNVKSTAMPYYYILPNGQLYPITFHQPLLNKHLENLKNPYSYPPPLHIANQPLAESVQTTAEKNNTMPSASYAKAVQNKDATSGESSSNTSCNCTCGNNEELSENLQVIKITLQNIVSQMAHMTDMLTALRQEHNKQKDDCKTGTAQSLQERVSYSSCANYQPEATSTMQGVFQTPAPHTYIPDMQYVHPENRGRGRLQRE